MGGGASPQNDLTFVHFRNGLELIASLENIALPEPCRLNEDQLAQVLFMSYADDVMFILEFYRKFPGLSVK